MELHGRHALEEVAVERRQLHVAFWDQAALHQRERVEREPRLHARDERAGDGGDADEDGEHAHAAV
eukprot:5270531-Prymnesium_polylepis.1